MDSQGIVQKLFTALSNDDLWSHPEIVDDVEKLADAYDELKAENEKLRKLVRIAIEYCDSGTCDGCPIQSESGGCPYSVMARELGVEVES